MAEFVKTEWQNGAAPGISAQELNRMEQGIYDAHRPIIAMVRAAAAQTIPSTGVPTRVIFGTVQFDPFNLWDPINNHLALPKGIYLVEAQVYCNEPDKMSAIQVMTDPWQDVDSLRVSWPTSKHIKSSGFLDIQEAAGANVFVTVSTNALNFKISETPARTFLHVVKISDRA